MPKGPPKVKTGPNRGKERARVQAGGYAKPPQWRRKREDDGKPRGRQESGE